MGKKQSYTGHSKGSVANRTRGGEEWRMGMVEKLQRWADNRERGRGEDAVATGYVEGRMLWEKDSLEVF